jgi:putative glutamine amidotransferase
MTPLIGLTTSTTVSQTSASWPVACATNVSYTDWVVRAGGAPVLLPNVDPALVDRLLDPLDGLLLTGGWDIQPLLFGAEPAKRLGTLDVPRDRFELPLARCAIDRGLPVFGICRGIQVVNVALGGTLRQDLFYDPEATVQHRMETVGGRAVHHTVTVETGSRLRDILGADRLPVNSYHHQAVGELGTGLRVTARAADGTVEAVEGATDTFLLGVQCHPEVMDADHAPTAALFSAFVGACRTVRV